MKTWIDEEISGSEFADLRLKKRFKTLISSMSNGLDRTIPFACGDWAATKAAYRFLDNDRVNESTILGGHFQATKARFEATDGPILVIQDTTEFSFSRNRADIIGITRVNNLGMKDADGRYREHISCGLLMHSSLAVTTEGLPLGLSAIKFWNRKKFKGCNALKKKINPTRVPIEEKESYRWLENLRQSTALFSAPERCVHVGDRESDIYELFCLAHDLGTNFLIRTCVNRLAGDGTFTIADVMDEVKIKGLHRLEIREKGGVVANVILEIKYKKILVKPPIGKNKRYPDQIMTVIHATERGKPKGAKKFAGNY